MIKFIKNVVSVVKSFINDDLDDDFIFDESSRRKGLQVKTTQHTPAMVSELEDCISDNPDCIIGNKASFYRQPAEELNVSDDDVVNVSEKFQEKITDNTNEIKNQLGDIDLSLNKIKDAIKSGKIDFSKVNYDPNETAQSMNSLIDTSKDLEQNDFTEIKSIVSDLSEKLTQYNKWLLELNDKISNYENREVLQAVSARADNGGYGIDLPLDVLENVDDEEFFKNKDIPEVLLANAKINKLITDEDLYKAFDIVKNYDFGQVMVKEPSNFVVRELETILGDEKISELANKQKQEDTLARFKIKHKQSTLTPNTSKLKLLNKQKSKTTKTKSPKKTKKASKSKSKKV